MKTNNLTSKIIMLIKLHYNGNMEKTQRWLSTKHPYLEGKTPNELINSNQSEKVYDFLKKHSKYY